MSDKAPFYYTVKGAASILGISEESVRCRIANGQLVAVKDKNSGRFLIPHAALTGQLEVATPAPDYREPAKQPMDPKTEAA